MLYTKSLSLPLGFYTEKRKGDIVARMTTDLVEIEWSIMSSLEMIFKDPLALLFFYHISFHQLAAFRYCSISFGRLYHR